MATPKSRAVFQEDDGGSFIGTDSTVESDLEAEYSVQKILADRVNQQGITQYLVEWEGYKMHRCTWEPRESFVDDDCLVNWNFHKRDVKQGLATPFDVGIFDDALAQEEKKREKRHAKRDEKRRKKAARRLVPRKAFKKGTARKADRSTTPSSATEGSPKKRVTPLFELPTTSRSAAEKRKRVVPASRSPSPALSVNDITNSQYSMFNEPKPALTETVHKSPSTHSTSVPKRARVGGPDGLVSSVGKETPKQRSGTAVNNTVSKPKATSSASSANKKSQLTDTPLQAEPLKAKDHGKAAGGSARPQPKLTKSSTAPNLSKSTGTAAPRRASDAILALPPTERGDDSKNKDTSSTTTTKPVRPATVEDPPSLRPSTAVNADPKVAPRLAGPSRRPPIKLFMDKSFKQRQRRRVNEYTPKDSTDTQFVNLALQRRMQLYSHNEPAPDPNALKFIDPSTGKMLDNADGTSTNALRLDTNVDRTSEVATLAKSAPALEIRPASMSEPKQAPLNGRTSTLQSAHEAAPNFAYPSAQPTAPRYSRKEVTCRFWYRGTCKNSEPDCIHAHEWTGLLEKKKPAPCVYFLKGGCRFSDEECEYQHDASLNPEDLGDINGFRTLQRLERLTRRRSESPDHSGKRQDEVERQRDRSNLSYFKTRPDMRSPVRSPSLTSTASFEPRNGVARDAHAAHPRRHTNVASGPPIDEVHSPDAAMSDPGNQSDLSEPINVCLTISPASPPVFTMDVKLTFDTKSSRLGFLTTVGENVSLEGSNICRSRDFEAYWYEADKMSASGHVLSALGDTMVAYLEDFLILQSSGVVVRAEDFVLVVYSTQNPEWKFMPHRGPEKPGLRWYLQRTGPEMLEPVVTKPTKSSFTSMCAEHLDLCSEVLFTANKGKQTDKSVYLFFPKEAPETRVVEAFLVDSKAKIFFSDDYELWGQFCNSKGSAGVILFHPSMNAFWKVPEFYNVLATAANVFQLGVSKSIKSRPDLPMKYSCTRLFPNGSLTLITDDIFKHYPALAVRVLESFENIKLKVQGARCDRIYCRPGILDWLAELIDEDREKGILAEDSPRIKCWQLACDLLGISVADNSCNPFRSDLAPPPLLYSPPKSQIPEYSPLWDSSEQEATDFLVGWFAGHCVDECESYRRFTVIYEQHGATATQTPGLLQSANPKDPKGWMKNYRHLKVTTPNRFLAVREEYERSRARQR